MTSPDPRQPQGGGSALATGLVLVLWGAFLYFYPQAVNLPSWVQTGAIFLAFACFILGAVTAGAGISDLRQSEFMSHFGIAVALALVAYVLYFLSHRVVDQPTWSTVARIVVIPVALMAMLMFGVGISHLLQGPSGAHDAPPATSAEPLIAGGAERRPTGAARFERIAGVTIAFVSLAAAIVALINEIRRGL